VHHVGSFVWSRVVTFNPVGRKNLKHSRRRTGMVHDDEDGNGKKICYLSKQVDSRTV